MKKKKSHRAGVEKKEEAVKCFVVGRDCRRKRFLFDGAGWLFVSELKAPGSHGLLFLSFTFTRRREKKKTEKRGVGSQAKYVENPAQCFIHSTKVGSYSS